MNAPDYFDDAPPHTDDDAPRLFAVKPIAKVEPAPQPAPRFAFRTIAQIGDGWLDVPPPPRPMLLTRGGKGVMPVGVAGFLVAPGARGKSMALAQLAVSVATGRPWLGAFEVARTGRVLLMLAEEEMEEIRRRIFWITRALNLSPDEMQLVAERVVPVGLSGDLVALVTEDLRGNLLRTDVFDAIAAEVNAHEYVLVCLDPLSRFAPTAESENALATGAIQCLESFAKSPGRPAVLMAHHTNKASRQNGNASDAANIRGVTALTDGVRWQANLGGKNESDLEIKVVKSNYTPADDDLRTALLTREENGVLRALSAEEVEARREAEPVGGAALRADVYSAIRSTPGIGSVQLRKLVGGNAAAVDGAARSLVTEGRVVDRGTERAHRYHVAEEVESVEQG